MDGFHRLVDRWGAHASGIVLLALPLARWYFGAPLGWMDMVVGGIGIGALLVALEDFLRRRGVARSCPHCGGLLIKGA